MDLLPTAFTALVSVVITGMGAYLLLVRRVMTRNEHKDFCKQVQEITKTKFENVEKQQEKQGRLLEKVDGKLDRLVERVFGGG